MDGNQTGVEFRIIPSLPEEFYRAGSDGSIWSCQKPGRGAGKVGKWRRLNPSYTSGGGYAAYRIGVANFRKKLYGHHVILEAFHGLRPLGMECRHLNGDRTDNRATNLKWGTSQENADDNLRLGKRLMGSKIPWSKLTEDIVRQIRKRREAGETLVSISRSLKVSNQTVGDVLSGRTWKQVE